MPHSGQRSGVVSWTMTWSFSQYQTGIWCPHQSWRDTHHGRIWSIQEKKMRSAPFGWKRTRPSRTAAIAGAASSSIRQNHCSETSGSTRTPERWSVPDGVHVRALRADEPALAQVGQHALRRLGDREIGIALAGVPRSCARRSR